jgi:DNA-binding response OmpR family regulator
VNAATATVLTVEDDPIVRSDLRLALEDAGYDVCADARDGLEAVALARLHAPDLIVLDLGLPRLDGVETARWILEERTVPIVALTGRSRRLVSDVLDVGAVACLHKPFAVDELVATISAALGSGRPDATREESRAAIAEIVTAMGYPEDWADDIEQWQYRLGRSWRRRR